MLFKTLKINKAAALGCAALFFSCENNIQEVKSLTSGRNIPPTEIFNHEIIRSDSGIVTSIMRGGKITISTIDEQGNNINREVSDGLEIIIFKKNTKIPQMILTSLEGADYPLREKAEARKNVVIVNEKGDSLFTERLIWDKEKKIIYSDSLTRIILDGDLIIGKKGFLADEDMNRTRLFQTEGIISVEDSLK